MYFQFQDSFTRPKTQQIHLMRAPNGMTMYLDRSGTILQEFSPERGIIKIKDILGTTLVWYRQTPPSTIPIHQSFAPNGMQNNIWSGGAMNPSYPPSNATFRPMPNLMNQNYPSAPPPYEEIGVVAQGK